MSHEELKHQLLKKDIEIARLKKLHGERRWYGKKEIHYFLQKEYEVILELSNKYSVNALCKEMTINRSGFYKWLLRRVSPSIREINRNDACRIFQDYHDKFPSHGYHWLNAKIKLDLGVVYSDNYSS